MKWRSNLEKYLQERRHENFLHEKWAIESWEITSLEISSNGNKVITDIWPYKLSCKHWFSHVLTDATPVYDTAQNSAWEEKSLNMSYLTERCYNLSETSPMKRFFSNLMTSPWIHNRSILKSPLRETGLINSINLTQTSAPKQYAGNANIVADSGTFFTERSSLQSGNNGGNNRQ